MTWYTIKTGYEFDVRTTQASLIIIGFMKILVGTNLKFVRTDGKDFVIDIPDKLSNNDKACLQAFEHRFGPLRKTPLPKGGITNG